MSITRRLFLRNTAAASAVVATVATPAIVEAMEPEHPWAKVRRIARDLSDALAEVDDGNIYAEIFPPGRQTAIYFGDADVLEDSRTSYRTAADVIKPSYSGIK